MPNDMMIRCEAKKLYKVDDKKEWRWVEVPVAEVTGDDRPAVRCMHCHGAVSIHKQQVEHGPQDHVEHRSREDSENCQGGHYFLGDHRMSARPVI